MINTLEEIARTLFKIPLFICALVLYFAGMFLGYIISPVLIGIIDAYNSVFYYIYKKEIEEQLINEIELAMKNKENE